MDCRSDASLATEAAGAPVTKERKLNLDLQQELPKPYLARALVAVDPSHPNGTEGWDNRNLSVLQQHVAFFDRNGDGKVYPWETYQGFRAIGCGFLASLGAAIFVNLFLSFPTQQGWIPSPLFPIYIRNIHKAKHGSDSETYDTEGRFDPSKFDAIFSKYARTHANALTANEVSTMLKANRNALDFIGRLFVQLEEEKKKKMTMKSI
ncbi:Peroxygenase [Ananas comosus]|uniref:Peroxygenase n=1 Tax=Ananas comosus TaxID=4615 RepID=A0A199W1C2_ANACO|nr:Peroxygenase [Ananas comosus]